MGKKSEREIVKAIEAEGLVVISRDDGSKHLRLHVGAPGSIAVGFVSVPHGNNHPIDGWLKLNRSSLKRFAETAGVRSKK